MNKEKLVKYCTKKDIADTYGIDGIECVFDPVNGKSICLYFSNITKVLDILNDVEYVYVDKIKELLKLYPDTDTVHVNLTSKAVKFYYAFNSKIYGITIVDGITKYKSYKVNSYKKTIHKIVDSKIATTYVPINSLKEFSVKTGISGCHYYKSTLNRYYAILLRNSFEELAYNIIEFIYSCE